MDPNEWLKRAARGPQSRPIGQAWGPHDWLQLAAEGRAPEQLAILRGAQRAPFVPQRGMVGGGMTPTLAQFNSILNGPNLWGGMHDAMARRRASYGMPAAPSGGTLGDLFGAMAPRAAGGQSLAALLGSLAGAVGGGR